MLTEFELKQLITNYFLKVCKNYKFPILQTEKILERQALDFAKVEILPDVKQIIEYQPNGRFFRYDLTLGLAMHKYLKRAEMGLVFRRGPSGRYRLRLFQQADLDVVYSDVNVHQFLTVYSMLVKKLVPSAKICYNSLQFLQKKLKLTDTEFKIKKIALDKQKQVEAFDNLFIQSIKNKFQKYPIYNGLVTPNLVRGLHMYRDFVFEVYVPDLRHAIGSGGHYKLGQMEYIGGSLGVSRLARYLEDRLKYPLVLLLNLRTEVVSLVKYAILEHFIIAEFKDVIQNVKYQIIKAVKNGYEALIIIGEREFTSNKFSKKNLRDSSTTWYNINPDYSISIIDGGDV